jgi:hypothetical protein
MSSREERIYYTAPGFSAERQEERREVFSPREGVNSEVVEAPIR